MKYIIKHKTQKIKGEIKIPPSKSISNRALILNAINHKIKIKNLSKSKDTIILKQALKQIQQGKTKIFIGNCGTAMRFLTAYLSTKKKKTILYGNKRMNKRPIKPLIDCLKSMGAKINYLEKTGFPPISIQGTNLKGGNIKITGDLSSQIISAIILIASEYKKPIKMTINNNIVSKGYIMLSLQMMSHFNIQNSFNKNIITVNNNKLANKEYIIEGDWSCAAYWYNLASCAKECNLKLYNLNPTSKQPDIILKKLYSEINVDTYIKKKYIQIIKNNRKAKITNYNLINSPDIFPSLLTTCVLNNIKIEISGIEHVKYKESNRISAMNTEINKTGAIVKKNNNFYNLEFNKISYENLKFKSYWDHRIIMSLMVFAMKNKIEINNPKTVDKSYPDFWKNVKKIGFKITKCS